MCTTGSLWLLYVNGHLGYFHVLAIVCSPAVNIGIHVSFSKFVSSGYTPSGIAGSYDVNPCLLRFLHWQMGSLPLETPGKFILTGDYNFRF